MPRPLKSYCFSGDAAYAATLRFYANSAHVLGESFLSIHIQKNEMRTDEDGTVYGDRPIKLLLNLEDTKELHRVLKGCFITTCSDLLDGKPCARGERCPQCRDDAQRIEDRWLKFHVNEERREAIIKEQAYQESLKNE